MSLSSDKTAKANIPGLAERIYNELKQDICEFRLLPGDRFTETEIATRMMASRTPVRQALFQLQSEGFLEVYFRSGWQVRPFDFAYFEELYDLRILLEQAAVTHLCQQLSVAGNAELEWLNSVWLVEPQSRLQDGQRVSVLDEQFHCQLVTAAGNREMARVHAEISDKIRIIRRLDFSAAVRIEATYDEHADILRAIAAQDAELACRQLRCHIEVSKAEVRNITLQKLAAARCLYNQK